MFFGAATLKAAQCYTFIVSSYDLHGDHVFRLRGRGLLFRSYRTRLSNTSSQARHAGTQARQQAASTALAELSRVVVSRGRATRRCRTRTCSSRSRSSATERSTTASSTGNANESSRGTGRRLPHTLRSRSFCARRARRARGLVGRMRTRNDARRHRRVRTRARANAAARKPPPASAWAQSPPPA